MDDFRQPPPKPDPNRWSTNKRVKALGENIFGTKVLTAEGPRKVRPGDPNATSAKFQPAGESVAAENRRLHEEAKKREEAKDLIQESFLTQQRAKKNQRGYITPYENNLLEYLNRRNPKRI